jgi:hypothetical protein
MNQILETVPTTWSDADERFFAVVTRLLPAEYLLGATVLLAGYDDDTVDVTVDDKVDVTVDVTAPSRPTASATSVASTPQQGVQAPPR